MFPYYPQLQQLQPQQLSDDELAKLRAAQRQQAKDFAEDKTEVVIDTVNQLRKGGLEYADAVLLAREILSLRIYGG